MRAILRFTFCVCIVSLGLTLSVPNTPSACAAGAESKSCELVVDALNAATKLKVGMARANLEKDFELDGGMSVQDRGTYTYRTCHNIKVNIEFKVHEQPLGTYTFSPEDEVSKISAPFLAYPLSD